MKRILLITLVLWGMSVAVEAQKQAVDSLKVVTLLENYVTKTPDLVELASCFIGAPYKAGTLEQENEPLVVNLREFDCVTFVETVLALKLALEEQPDYAGFCRQLERLRYRNGVRDGYLSRLHYFSEWIAQAERNGILREWTCEWGGLPYACTFDVLSRNAAHIPALMNANDEQLEQLRQMEKDLSQQHYCRLPKEDVSHVQENDIIAFCSSGKGIDVYHVGFVISIKGKLHLLHASSTQKKVVVSEQDLLHYMAGIKRFSGYRILRLAGR